MPSLLSEVPHESGARPGTRTGPHSLAIVPDRGLPSAARRRPTDPSGAMSLHISKLRGMTDRVRARLKRYGITYTDQLLEAAGRTSRRWQLAAGSGIEAALLGRLACRADLTRIKGIGAIFADMLELLGVDRSVRLARQDPAELHRALVDLNAALRLARRAPTAEEVEHWIAQARSLPHQVEDDL
jgi:predicted flap endonuclease-1-like 5' DNA nuclease